VTDERSRQSRTIMIAAIIIASALGIATLIQVL